MESRESPTDQNADERRLFYVAITRAKESVTITHARRDGGREALPSVFLDEIKGELVESVNGNFWDEKFKDDAGFGFRENPSPLTPLPEGEGDRTREQEFVKSLFEKQGMSPTALNNYLQCPWKYFYVNLVRIPAAQTLHQLYGIAIHATLQDFYKNMKSNDPTREFLLESFKGHLYRQPLSPRDLDVLFAKGTKSLVSWFETYDGTWNANALTEFRINGVLLDDHIKLTGSIDNMEFVDGSDVVNVIDYKTGKRKTRNEIMGKTKDSDGNYYRQLTFYKLLLNLYADGKYSMQSGILDFIEPDDKGKNWREEFEISNDEVSELSREIRRVADEIVNLKFWDATCDDQECEYCRMRKLVK